jgi:uncharacterized protein
MRITLPLTAAAVSLFAGAAVHAASPEAELADAKRALGRGDLVAALNTYQSLADAGNPEGMRWLGIMHARGLAVRRNPQMGCDLFEKAANAGSSTAFHMVGDCFFNGDGRPIDYSQSAAWYERAIAAGDITANCALGNQYLDGNGVSRDIPRAVALCRIPADAGDANAQTDLARALLLDPSREAKSEAVALLLKAAAQKQHNAAYALGMMYASGENVPADSDAALRYMRIAADAGHRGAPLMIGLFYHLRAVEIGRVDPFPVQSVAMQALYWLGKAERGDPRPKARAEAAEKIAELSELFPDAVKALADWRKTESGPPPLT